MMTSVEPPARRRRACRPIALAALAALLLALGSRTASAQAEESEALIRQGMELRKQGQDARALPLLERAYRASRTPRTAAQLGLVQMALGYWVEAERHLDEALLDPDNPWVAKNRQALAGARARVQGMVAELTITGQPAGAEVFVNGRSVGRLPLGGGVRLGKGPVEIELRADGYVTASRSMTLAGGGHEQVSLSLVRAVVASDSDRAPAVAPVDPDAPKALSARPAAPLAIEAPLAPRSSTTARPLARGAAWAGAALTVAGVAFGVVETFAAQNKLDAFNNHTIASPTAQDPNRRVQDCTTSQLSSACASLRDDYQHAKTLALVGYVAGGVFAAATIVLFVVSSAKSDAGAASAARSPPRPGAVSLIGCAPDLAATGLICNLRF